MLYVKCAHEGKTPEWTLLDLQGGLSPAERQAALAGLNLGTVVTVGQAHTLTIGKHRLEGKLVPIKKPFAVLQKRCSPGETGEEAGYAVMGVIRQKLQFKSRPKPLVA